MSRRKYGFMRVFAMILAGCILWGGCGMGAPREQSADVLEDAGESGDNIQDAVGVVFPVGQNPRADKSAAESTYAAEDTVAVEDTAPAESPLLEQLFSYEIREPFWDPYLVITGVAEKYRDSFWENMSAITGKSSRYKYMLIPADINGVPVRVVGEEAFAGMDIQGLGLPDTLTIVEAGAFENCALEKLEFPDGPLSIEERAFAGNGELWTALIPDARTVLAEGVFEDCRDGFLLCYGSSSAEQENLVAGYAKEQGFDSMEIVLSEEPIVNYPPEPLVLKPEIRNFFYGDYDESKEELWCSWEEDQEAPNFGYIDWQAPGCSSWCGVVDFEREAVASSELASPSGRYAAANVLMEDRQGAWAEGVEGPGIGESLLYRQSCTTGISSKWEAMTYDYREPVRDGFMHYSEICIVNGYAKTQKTWEENGRIKKLLMYVENCPYAYLELEDTILPQYFLLPEEDIKVPDGGMLEVRFEIAEVYPGSLYEDTCLTGLMMEFIGRYAH
ncbi:MAG: leucine-rich repeat domain-containing protein [Lachnospiraceae bacterium]|nr:leucine-rich repeat domain-containing protein [Lachnospiraceae bacterium]